MPVCYCMMNGTMREIPKRLIDDYKRECFKEAEKQLIEADICIQLAKELVKASRYYD